MTSSGATSPAIALLEIRHWRRAGEVAGRRDREKDRQIQM